MKNKEKAFFGSYAGLQHISSLAPFLILAFSVFFMPLSACIAHTVFTLFMFLFSYWATTRQLKWYLEKVQISRTSWIWQMC